jgi:hypothetical protein
MSNDRVGCRSFRFQCAAYRETLLAYALIAIILITSCLYYSICGSFSEVENEPLTVPERRGDSFAGGVPFALRTQPPMSFNADTKPANGELRRVEVTALGRVDEVKGVDWPLGPDGELAISAWVSEPTEVTINVDAKQLRLHTRPILILSQANGIVVSIFAPPATAKTSMRNKVIEIDRLLDDWKVVPNKRMRETLDDFKMRDYAGGSASLIVPDLRAALAPIGERCTVSVRFSSGDDGLWHAVLELQATADASRRVREDGKPKRLP